MYTEGTIVAGDVEIPLMKMVVEYDSLARESSGRDDNGKMHIEWIRNRIRKIKCTLPPTTSDKVGEYLNAVIGKTYKVLYRDPIYGITEMSAYTSNGSVEMYNARLHGGLWYNISFSAIEM